MHICSQKVARSLRKHHVFLLYNYDHDIIINDKFWRYMIGYDKQLLEYNKEESDQFGIDNIYHLN